jgi:hypothetical protein
MADDATKVAEEAKKIAKQAEQEARQAEKEAKEAEKQAEKERAMRRSAALPSTGDGGDRKRDIGDWSML